MIKISLNLLSAKALLTLFFVGSLVVSSVVHAVGTPANTTISNTATVNFVRSGIPMSASATSTLAVEELLDVTVAWQDASNIRVISPSSSQVLTYLVTNLGNGIEDFILDVATPNPVPQFDAQNIQIWHDTDNDGAFNALNDTQILLGGTINLNGGDPASDSSIVFVLSDIPAGQSGGDLSAVELIATSSTADANSEVGNVTAVIANGGDGGSIDALVGGSGASASVDGFYEVVPSIVTITKSATVTDNNGGNSPFPGSVIRYSLVVDVAGTDPVNNLVVRDPVPANTSYDALNDSIVLDGATQTNANDAPSDFAYFDSSGNAIVVDLSEAGTVSITPPAVFTITFDVTID